MNQTNKLVWLFSGTSDGNQIAQESINRGYDTKVFVASMFGKQVASEKIPVDAIFVGRLSKQNLLDRCKLERPDFVLDATHPYAVEISHNLMEFCFEKGVPYVRYERPEEIIEAENIYIVDTMQAAAECSMRLGKRLLLTTGSKNIDPFVLPYIDCEIFVRMLPDPDLICQVLEKGISPKNIIAMRGPFSLALNLAILDSFKIDCLITKSSGKEGGYVEKVLAAREAGIPVVVIKRPLMNYPSVFQTKDKLFRFLNG